MSEYIFAMKEIMLHGVYIDSVSCEKKEEIVRCRDCESFCEENENYGIPRSCLLFQIHVHHDDYCAWGVRRDD